MTSVNALYIYVYLNICMANIWDQNQLHVPYIFCYILYEFTACLLAAGLILFRKANFNFSVRKSWQCNSLHLFPWLIGGPYNGNYLASERRSKSKVDGFLYPPLPHKTQCSRVVNLWHIKNKEFLDIFLTINIKLCRLCVHVCHKISFYFCYLLLQFSTEFYKVKFFGIRESPWVTWYQRIPEKSGIRAETVDFLTENVL